MSSDYFGDYQQQMASKMSDSLKTGAGDGMREVAQATSNLQQTSMQGVRQQQQMSSLVQQQQMQIQQLTTTLQQMLMQMRMSAASSLASAPPPPMHYNNVQGGAHTAMYGAAHMVSGAAVGGARFAYNAISDAGMGAARDAYGGARGFYNNVVNPYSPTPHGFGGEVSAGHRSGAMASMANGMGSFYNPSTLKSATFGAYQRGIANNMGQRAQNLTTGAMGALGSLASFSTLGSAIGGKVIPIPLVGEMIGGALGAPLDVLNPVAYGMEGLKRASYLGDMSNHASQGFLRGRSGFQTGRFNMREEGDIGLKMRKALVNDLTFSNEDVGQLMKGGAESGQFLGVQNSNMYVDRIKKKLETAKMVMKVANLAAADASSLMGDAFNGMGFNHGTQQNRFFASAAAMAPLAGMDMRQMVGVASAGAQQYAGAGMLSTTGARQGMQTRALAGMGATFKVGSDTLASVGGEDGLARVIGQATQKYLQGAGGQMLALGGGGYRSFGEGISNATRGIQSSGDMVGFMANRNKKLDEATQRMGPMGVQAQQARDLLQLADEYKGIGGSTKDRMRLLARSQYGLNDTEADGLVDSFGALKQGFKQQRTQSTRNFQDMLRDQAQERNGFGSKMRLGYRKMMENTMGGAGFIEDMMHFSDSVGEKVQNGTQRAFDMYSGVNRRYVNEDTVKKISDTKSLMDLDSGQKGGNGNMSVGKMAERLNYVRDTSTTGGAIGELKDYANKHGGKHAVEAMAASSWALRTGKQFTSGKELLEGYRSEQAGRKMTDADKTDALNAGALTGVNQETLEGMGKELGAAGDLSKKHRSKVDLASQLRRELGVDMASDSDVIGGATNDTVKAIVEQVKALFSMYDPRKGDSQGEDFESKSRELATLIGNVEDPASKKLVDSMLREAGVTVTPGGNISFAGSMKKLEKQSGIRVNSRFGRSPGEIAIQAALKDHASGKSWVDIRKDNKQGADYLMAQQDKGKLGSTSLGVLSSTNASGAIDEASEAALSESKVKAVKLGLSMMGSKGSALRAASSSALGGVNTESGSLSMGVIGSRFAGISDEKLKEMAGGDDVQAQAVAKITQDLKSGRLTSEQAGNKIAMIAMKAGNMGGELVEGAGVDAALGDNLIGSDAMRQMVTNMELQNSVLQNMLTRLEGLE